MAALAARTGDVFLAVDGAGERTVGAPLFADDRIRTDDSSQCLDDESVLPVSGHIAGTTGIALKADMARSLGALHVRALILRETCIDILGCNRITTLLTRRHTNIRLPSSRKRICCARSQPRGFEADPHVAIRHSQFAFDANIHS